MPASRPKEATETDEALLRSRFHRLFYLFVAAFTVGLLSTVATTRHYVQSLRENASTAEEELKKLTHGAAMEIDSMLRAAIEAADGIAEDLSTGKLSKKAALGPMRKTLKEHRHFYGGTVTFKPYGRDADTKLFSAYLHKKEHQDELVFIRLDRVYDYTQREWYTGAMTKGSRWGEPYWDEAVNTFLMTYSAVFHERNEESGKKEPAGVVTIDISIAEIRRFLESLDLGPSGFPALTTRNGAYLYHPNDEYVRNSKTLLDIAREKNDSDREKMAADALRGKGGVLDHVSRTTGEASWLIYESIPVSGWSLQNTFIKKDISVDLTHLRRQLIHICGSVCLLIMGLAALLLRLREARPRALWIHASISTFTLMCAIAFVWWLALAYNSTELDVGAQISDKATLKRIIRRHRERSVLKNLPVPYYVPTGILLESVSLDDSSQFTVNGIIWQQHPVDMPEDIPQGLRFGNARTVVLKEMSRRRQNNHITTLWHFQASLRQHLDFSEYPLDQEALSIRILPRDTEGRVALVPDLSAYSILSPSTLPGLGPDTFIPGWRLLRTAFRLQPHKSRTNFGNVRKIEQIDFPDLHFNIVARRDFFDSFVSNLTPLILVAILLYGVLLICGEIDPGRSLSTCSGMLFVIVFSHIGIRSGLTVAGLFYLEYFYFMIYFAILWVSFCAIRKPLNIRYWLFQYKDNLISKVGYWPTMMGILLIFTMYVFY